MTKKLLAFILTFSLLLSVIAVGMVPTVAAESEIEAWDGSVATSFAGGDGTKGNPYQIANGAQLAYMYTSVQTTGSSFSNGKYFMLTADIYLNDTTKEDWLDNSPRAWYTSKSDNGYRFTGNFDGNGHTVYGLYYSGESGYQGLLPVMDTWDRDVYVKNLTISDSFIASEGSIVGAVSSRLYSGNKKTAHFYNVNLTESVTVLGQDGGSVGGILGFSNCDDKSYYQFYGCSVLATVSSGNALIGYGTTSTIAKIEQCYTTSSAWYTTNSKQYDSAYIVSAADIKGSVAAKAAMPGLDWDKAFTCTEDGYPTPAGYDIGSVKGAIWSGFTAPDFAAGSGTSEDPYIIETAEQLAKLVRTEYTSGKYYKLGAHIVLNDTSAENWTETATMWFNSSQVANAFAGTLDGAGYTVSGIYYKGTGFSSLIPKVKGATIKNIRISNSSLTNTGTSNDNNVSGFASYVDGAVSFDSCIVDETVTLTSGASAAGFAGYGASDVTITNCGVSATITGTRRISAMLADFWGGTQTIKNSYSVGTPITGYRSYTGSNNYSDTSYSTDSGVTILTTEQMTGADALTNMPSLKGFGATETYPVLYQQGTKGQPWTGSIATEYASGNGTDENPYTIETAEQLVKLVKDTNTAGKYFKLTADIMVNDTTAENWTASAKPWFTYNSSGEMNTFYFKGNLDGNFHTISGLYYNGADYYVGLFGGAGGTGTTISRVIIDNISLVTEDMVSAFVGYVNGAITYDQCVIGENAVIKGSYASGFGSYGSGNLTVKNSMSVGQITATSGYAGAFFADVWSSTLTINGSFGVGAFSPRRSYTGSNNYGTVTDNYGIKVVSEENMKGEDARYNMPGLNWGKNWEVDANGGYPIPVAANPEGTVGKPWTGDIATKYASGTGAETDPFIIKTAEQLAKLVNDLETEGKFYKLDADIMINDTSVGNWTQIAKSWFDYSKVNSAKFAGTLDGDNHTISGLYYNGTGYAALIPYAAGTVTIKNLHIKHSSVNNTGSDSSSHNAAALISRADAGNTSITIEACFVDETVSLTSVKSAAAFVGYGTAVVTVKNSGVAAVINAGRRPGAFISDFWGAGALTVSNSYAVGAKLSGNIAYTATNTYSSVESGTGVTQVAENAMKGEDSIKNMPNLKFFSPSSDSYPVLYRQGTKGEAWTGSIALNFAGGAGTKANPYIIETAEQLVKLIADKNTAGKYYTITADIIINDTSADNWTDSALKWLDYYDSGSFAGTLNGEFHTISGLYYSGSNSVGLFSTIGKSGATATINKVIVADTYFTSTGSATAAFGAYVNGAAVYNDCVVADTVTLIGKHASGFGSYGSGNTTVNNSMALATLSGSTYAGAFLADVWSSTLKITNSIGIGTFSPKRSYTGLNNYGTVEDAYGVNVVTVEQMKGAEALINMPNLTGYFVTESFPVRYFVGITGAAWSGGVANEFASGTGTKADPYVILTAEQLARMLNTASKNNHYILGTDIVLSDDETKNNWLDSTNSLPFSGNFNGNGYVIGGLYYDKTVTSGVNVGLIPVADGAYISGVILDNSNINVVTNAAVDTYVGALVGYVQGSRTTLYTCYVAEDVAVSNTRGTGISASNAVGGFIGGGNAAPVTIDGSAYFGTIAANEYRYGTLFGNIWGGQEADRTVKNTITDANMTPSSYWSFVGEKNVSTVASTKDIYETFTVVTTLKGEEGFAVVDSIANWNDRYFGTEGYPMLSSLAKRYGDVNCDATFDQSDIIMVRKYLIGASKLGYVDVNRDGTKDITDLVKARIKIDSASKPGGYQLVWNDEFDGTKLDDSKWSTQTRMSDTSELAQSNMTSVRKVAEGNLQLTAMENPYYNPNGSYFEQHQYMTSGSVTTEGKMSYQYGYLEIRAKVPYAAGVWPSFWLRSHNATGKQEKPKYEVEVDVFEVFGSENTLASNLHQQNFDGKSYQTGGTFWNDINQKEEHTFANADNLSNEYHTYAFEWEPDRMAIYVDGVLNVEWKLDTISLWTMDLKTNTTGFNTTMNILFNNHLFTESSNYIPSTGTIENAEGNLPAEFDIDYVRLYQKNDGVSKLIIGE